MHNVDVPAFTGYKGEKRIALLDNSAIAFLEQMEQYGVAASKLLRGYETILIPNWVWEEVRDSTYRREYINRLRKEKFPVSTIAEEKYDDLAEGEEGNLYKIVLASASCLGPLKSYLRRYVEEVDPLEMDPYCEWISEMYQKWPLSKLYTATGREKRKNAGEISLTILAEVFSWYYPDIELITIYTQDRDAYDYQTNAHRILQGEFQKRTSVEIGYKSNDFLICQMYRNSMIGLDKIKEVRKDIKTVLYSQTRWDQSIILAFHRLENEQFAELIQDSSFQVIF